MKYHVRVSFERKDRGAAEQWFQKHTADLRSANAPIDFYVIEKFEVGREIRDHAEAVTLRYANTGALTSSDSALTLSEY